MRLVILSGRPILRSIQGARLVKLLFELIPETAGQRAGGFRVLSPDGAVESFAFFGDLTGDWISTIPGE